MLVSEAVRRIKFKTNTLDDIAGKSTNNLFTNQAILDEFNSQISEYARITKGIEDIYSFPINTNTPFVAAPTYALKSEAYYFIGYISGGTIFGTDMRGAPEIYNTFRYSPMAGIVNWIMPWANGYTKYFSMFPNAGSSAPTTTVTGTGGITAAQTTIPVTSAASFISRQGRITIGSEKILYQYKDATNFYGCVRGVEMTTAAVHAENAVVSLNNIFMHYARMSVPLTVTSDSDDTISAGTLAIVLDVCEEHLQGIIKLTAYNLLLKIDPERAMHYKVDSDAMFQQYALEIMRGAYAGRGGVNVREAFPTNEAGVAFGGNLIF